MYGQMEKLRHADTLNLHRVNIRVIIAKLLPARKRRMADFPSGQRDLTVNQALHASVVRIHYPPPRPDSSVVEHFIGKEEVASPILARGSTAG